LKELFEKILAVVHEVADNLRRRSAFIIHLRQFFSVEADDLRAGKT
jgi:hypothetical protein